MIGIVAAVLLASTPVQPEKSLPAAADPPTGIAQAYDCARKTCKKMRSCEEACYKFKVCGMTGLDRDRDSIPCENICSRPCP